MATRRKKTKKRQASRTKHQAIRIGTISPTVAFKALILLATLIVATIAIKSEAYDTQIWTFLGSMLMYAALSSGQIPSK